MRIIDNLFVKPYQGAFQSLKIGKEEIYYSLNGKLSKVGKERLSNVKIESRSRMGFKGILAIGSGCIKLIPFLNALIYKKLGKPTTPKPSSSVQNPPLSQPSPTQTTKTEAGIENAGNTCYIASALHTFNAFVKSQPNFTFKVIPDSLEDKGHFAERQKVAQTVETILAKIRSGETCPAHMIQKFNQEMVSFDSQTPHSIGINSKDGNAGDANCVFRFLINVFFQPSHTDLLFANSDNLIEQLPEPTLLESGEIYFHPTQANIIRYIELCQALPSAEKLRKPLKQLPTESVREFELRKIANERIQKLLTEKSDAAFTDLYNALHEYYEESDQLIFFKKTWYQPQTLPSFYQVKNLLSSIVSPSVYEKTLSSQEIYPVSPTPSECMGRINLLERLKKHLEMEEFFIDSQTNNVFEISPAKSTQFPNAFIINLSNLDRIAKKVQPKEIPQEFSFKTKDGTVKYQLTGVRKGDLAHSVFFGYSDNQWNFFNDDRVSKLNPNDVTNNIAFGDIFIYSKVL